MYYVCDIKIYIHLGMCISVYIMAVNASILLEFSELMHSVCVNFGLFMWCHVMIVMKLDRIARRVVRDVPISVGKPNEQGLCCSAKCKKMRNEGNYQTQSP